MSVICDGGNRPTMDGRVCFFVCKLYNGHRCIIIYRPIQWLLACGELERLMRAFSPASLERLAACVDFIRELAVKTELI